MIRAVREQVEFLQRNGFNVESQRNTAKGHVILRVSKGRRTGLITIAGTPSDHRARLNMLNCARRACGVG